MIVRLPARKEFQPGSATSELAPLRKTGREAAADGSLPTRGKRVSDFRGLLAEDENTSLARKADFPYLSVLSEQQRIIDGLAAALFPSAFGFGNNLPALLDDGLVSIDLQPVFPGLQFGLAEFGGLRNVDGLGERFCECRYCQCQGGQQNHTADK